MLDLTQNNKKDFSEDFFVFAAKNELKIGDVVISFSELNFPTKLVNSDVIDLFKGYPSIHLGVNRSGEISLVDSSELKTGDNVLSLGKLKYPILIDSPDKLQDLQKLPVNKFFVKTFEIKRNMPRMSGEELLNKAKFKNVQDQDFLYIKKSDLENKPSEYSELAKEDSPAVVKNLNHKDKVAQTRKEDREHLEKLQKNIVTSGAVKEEGAVLLEELFAQGNIQPSHLKDLQHVSEKIFEQNKLEPNSANILMLLKDHDEYTFRHSVDVANQLLFVLMKMNKYTEDDLRVFTLGALMHDIGKSKIPSYILNKPGPLSENEWKLMRMHPVHSAEIMLGLSMDPKQIEIGLKHHVRKDGTGYPDWVDYTDMTEVARLSVIADVFQALVTKRTYKKADTAVTALKKINLGAEDIFDSRLVSTFIKAFGVFPVGSLVRLSSRSAGFVVNNDRVSLRPKVVVCMDEGNKLMEHPEVVDLNLPENYALEIISVMDHRVFFPSNNALEHFLSLKL